MNKFNTLCHETPWLIQLIHDELWCTRVLTDNLRKWKGKIQNRIKVFELLMDKKIIKHWEEDFMEFFK